jgi:hypothetical protein
MGSAADGSIMRADSVYAACAAGGQKAVPGQDIRPI